jgi:ADP-ribose pyrophosphatase YjhB (NUDIX family)
MRFCSQCGHPVELRIPAGDDRERHVCVRCEMIHYQNPRVIVGCLPVSGERILLCKRAIEPRLGYWTLPAGFLENGETTLAGAQRETWEEAQAEVANPVLYRIFDLPGINQIYMFYRGELIDNRFGAGTESLEVDLFHPETIPWQQLAFPVVIETLREYLADRERGEFPVRASGLDPSWRDWYRRAYENREQ